MGDMLCVIPAIRALHKAFPRAEITLAGLAWAGILVDRFPQYFQKFIHFPGYPGLPEQPVNAKAFTAFLTKVQEEEFDLALQMQGNGTLVNPMIELVNATYTAGFYTEGDYRPNENFFLRYPNFGHEIERHLLLMQHLGIVPDGTHLEFPITPNDEAEVQQLQLNLRPKQYVCIHPGSRGVWRQWPVAYFARLADYFFEQGLAVILTGTKDELDLVNSVANHMRYTPIITAGTTSIGAVAVLIKNAFMLVANCTGVSHIAAATQTPSVIISMDGEPERWGPLNTKLHTTINWLHTPDFDVVFNETTQLVASLRPGVSTQHAYSSMQ